MEEILKNIEHFDKLLENEKKENKMVFPESIQEFLAILTIKLLEIKGS